MRPFRFDGIGIGIGKKNCLKNTRCSKNQVWRQKSTLELFLSTHFIVALINDTRISNFPFHMCNEIVFGFVFCSLRNNLFCCDQMRQTY
jgi:hypothetical protein